ncbi:MAG TPA: NAD(P)H-dependent oxidoreductase [Smithellaceae bacterium]|nr:NAD(P)H-dependent oxidoreductase [Smithellaceae bacterium]HRS89750.1 NAD(P)H-dependent oxidoreductase [Smithellaceae bacterium]HRV26607.1 NAD(P)H-dependent oxidoreductase [Smithellaceae bacterium]
MNKILILFAHPRFENSKTSRALLKNIRQINDVTLHDLYEEYPDFNINIEREKKLLLAHQILVWHHPLYMYSAPALLKQWLDMVLEHGWAHGSRGNNLKDKIIFNALTIGGTKDAYTAGGHNKYTISEFLRPFAQTAALCKMIYLPPYAVHGTHLLSPSDLADYARLYQTLLEKLAQNDFDVDAMSKYDYLNDWLTEEMGANP